MHAQMNRTPSPADPQQPRPAQPRPALRPHARPPAPPDPAAPYATWPMNGATSAPIARDLVRLAMEQLGAEHEAVEAGVLCASELVANAARHAAGPVWLTVWAGTDTIGINVTDAAPDRPVVLPEWEQPRQITLEDIDSMDFEDPHLEHGRGLMLVVQACKGRCGVLADGASKTVWVSFPSPWSSTAERAAWWAAVPPPRRRYLRPVPFRHAGGGR